MSFYSLQHTMFNPHVVFAYIFAILVNKCHPHTVYQPPPNEEYNIVDGHGSSLIDINEKSVKILNLNNDECGNALTSEGRITSPNYPKTYPKGIQCKWKIKAIKGHRIVLNFGDFDVTSTENCTQDYLKIYEEDAPCSGSPTLLCGGEFPHSYHSKGGVLDLEFVTASEGETCRGFNVTVGMEEVIVSCSEETSFESFTFTNPSYPAPVVNESNVCQIKINHDLQQPVCQIRLDLEYMELQPPHRGDCIYDKFLIATSDELPPLCGINHGQHVYLDVRDRSSTHFYVETSPIFPRPVGHIIRENGEIYLKDWKYEVNPENRKWLIKVRQIPCYCDAEDDGKLAPNGCLQYFDGIKGIIRSFNFEGSKMDLDPCWEGNEQDCGRIQWTGHLNNLNYATCFSGMKGYCGIKFESTGPHAFLLTGRARFNRSEIGGENLFGSQSCEGDYIILPRSRTPGDGDPWTHDRFCGQSLGNYIKGPIISYSQPFYAHVITDEDEVTVSKDFENRGFELEFSLLPCSTLNMMNINFY